MVCHALLASESVSAVERRLQGAAEPVFEAGTIGPAERDLGTVLQPDAIVTVEIGQELGDAIDTDDARPVDAHELAGVEALLER